MLTLPVSELTACLSDVRGQDEAENPINREERSAQVGRNVAEFTLNILHCQTPLFETVICIYMSTQ